MTPAYFERAVEAYRRREPFRPFRVHFVSGGYVDVDHPESLVLRGGVAVYISPGGVPTLFDHEGVSEVTGETEKKSA